MSQLLVIFNLFELKISCPNFVSWLRSSNTLKNWKKMVRGAPPPRGSFLGSSGVCTKNFKILDSLEGGEKNFQSLNTTMKGRLTNSCPKILIMGKSSIRIRSSDRFEVRTIRSLNDLKFRNFAATFQQ